MSLRASVLTAGFAAFGLTAAANATFFSFASDNASNSFTFVGTAGAGGGGGGGAGSFTMSSGTNEVIQLMIDDNNMTAPTVTVPVRFQANFTLQHANSTPVFGSTWQHTYMVSGSYNFVHATTGALLLTGNIVQGSSGVFSVQGGQNNWATTGGVFGSDFFTDVNFVATSAFVTAINDNAQVGFNAGSYGVAAGTSVGPDDFAFGLTVLSQAQGALPTPVALNATTKLPTSDFRSESSYNGSAPNGIPTPGGAALVAAGGLLLSRRRR